MGAIRPRLLTADDLLQLDSKGVYGELIRGVLTETPATGFAHGVTLMNLGCDIANTVKLHGLGTLTTGCGIWLECDPDTVRSADLAFYARGRLPRYSRKMGYPEVVPDFVSEVASFSDTYRELNDKAEMWIRHGVRLVWVVFPDTRSVEVHREGHRVATLSDGDILDGLDVLPSFTYAVSEVFDT